MAFYFKTQGREYSFTLEHDGLLHSKDLGLSDATLEGLQAKVKAHVKAEKAAPRIPVIVLDDRWSYVEGYSFGQASSKADRSGYRWVSYKDGTEDKEKTKRRTFDSGRLFLDTPLNRMYADSLITLGKQISNLIEQSKEIRSQMSKIGDEQEEE
jgi:hypothetical protein